MEISAIVLTKNEEKNIVDCLKSLSWCNEVIVVDDNSTDATILLAKKHGATILEHSLSNDFAAQRNFALSKAKNEWIFFVDADERVSAELKNKIESVLKEKTNLQGLYVKRQDYMWGKALRHGEQGKNAFLRIGKKGAGEWVGNVHESWKIKGKTKVLRVPLQHYPHPTLTDFLREINFYSTLRAQELHKKGVKATWVSVLIHAKGKFAQDYFFKMGFLDGIEGFIVAMLMSFHAFLVRGKLWQLGKK